MESRGRSTPFSYRCRACSRCCYGKRISVSPYELARLADARGITTTELLDRHVEPEAPFLARRDDDACTFLGPGGCTVHPDRPLACRLYPLGRIVRDGEERFVHLTPHPETEGEYGDEGTIGAYLEAQGVRPFVHASDRLYAALINLQEPEDGGGPLARAGLLARTGALESDANSDPASDGRWILDVDAILERACQERGLETPAGLEERFDLYLETITEETV